MAEVMENARAFGFFKGGVRRKACQVLFGRLAPAPSVRRLATLDQRGNAPAVCWRRL